MRFAKKKRSRHRALALATSTILPWRLRVQEMKNVK